MRKRDLRFQQVDAPMPGGYDVVGEEPLFALDPGMQAGFVKPPAGLGKPHPDRAKQFKPFAALRGYYDLVKQTEHISEPRRMVTEERALVLSRMLESLRKGDMVRVTYYDGDAYVSITGMLSDVMPPLRRLVVIRTYVDFDDVWEIQRLDI